MQKATLCAPRIMFIVGAVGHGWYSLIKSKVESKDWKNAHKNRDFSEKSMPPDDNFKAK